MKRHVLITLTILSVLILILFVGCTTNKSSNSPYNQSPRQIKFENSARSIIEGMTYDEVVETMGKKPDNKYGNFDMDNFYCEWTNHCVSGSCIKKIKVYFNSDEKVTNIDMQIIET